MMVATEVERPCRSTPPPPVNDMDVAVDTVDVMIAPEANDTVSVDAVDVVRRWMWTVWPAAGAASCHPLVELDVIVM